MGFWFGGMKQKKRDEKIPKQRKDYYIHCQFSFFSVKYDVMLGWKDSVLFLLINFIRLFFGMVSKDFWKTQKWNGKVFQDRILLLLILLLRL